MRVVSLCPSLTELVFDLGRGDTLVGRTKFCVHPVGRVDAVPSVGGTKNPKVDRIIALAPDLVLLNEEENRREDAEALQAAGIACHISFPKDALETAAMVRSIGDALDAHDAAALIAAEIEFRRARVRAEIAGRGAAPVRFAYVIWRRPWMTVNGDTFVSAMLADAGGTNVFADRTPRYPTFEASELASAAPDRVLLASEPFPFDDRHIDELSAESGVPRDRFHLADGELLSWHGSRTAAGIDYAAQLMQEQSSKHAGQADPTATV